ncbi:hypothetical protein MOP88_11160 [Sphingomonas sp. WKB10]|nr:hypothetical protein [Sphingomonas sp. WKB10]
MRLSVTARIALLSILLTLAANIVLLGFVWKQTDAVVVDTVRRDTIEHAEAMRALYRIGGLPPVVAATAQAHTGDDSSFFIAVLDRKGRTVAGTLPPGCRQPCCPPRSGSAMSFRRPRATASAMCCARSGTIGCSPAADSTWWIPNGARSRMRW